MSCEICEMLREEDVVSLSSTDLDEDNVLEMWIQKEQYGYYLNSAITYHDYETKAITSFKVDCCPRCGDELEIL